MFLSGAHDYNNRVQAGGDHTGEEGAAFFGDQFGRFGGFREDKQERSDGGPFEGGLLDQHEFDRAGEGDLGVG